jgi:hypothetical protein
VTKPVSMAQGLNLILELGEGMEASTGTENESNINTKTETSFVVWITIVIFFILYN